MLVGWTISRSYTRRQHILFINETHTNTKVVSQPQRTIHGRDLERNKAYRYISISLFNKLKVENATYHSLHVQHGSRGAVQDVA